MINIILPSAVVFECYVISQIYAQGGINHAPDFVKTMQHLIENNMLPDERLLDRVTDNRADQIFSIQANRQR